MFPHRSASPSLASRPPSAMPPTTWPRRGRAPSASADAPLTGPRRAREPGMADGPSPTIAMARGGLGRRGLPLGAGGGTSDAAAGARFF